MKPIKDEELKALMTETQEAFGEYEKVKFVARVNGKPTELSGIRVMDAKDTEHFIVKTKNQGHFSFGTDEVATFQRISVETYTPEVENPISKLQQTIADKIQREKDKTTEDSERIADELIAQVGYFPLLNSATAAGLTVDFLDKNKELLDTIHFPFIKGEAYEVFSHEDDREIEINSLVIDVSLATDLEGDELAPETYAKYYETYKTLQDFEFIQDNDFTKEIFTLYKLDEKYAKVTGDLHKHDLLALVQENSKDEAIQEAARDLRLKSTANKKETVKFKP